MRSSIPTVLERRITAALLLATVVPSEVGDTSVGGLVAHAGLRPVVRRARFAFRYQAAAACGVPTMSERRRFGE
jgi:hypothetical protein